MRPGHIASPAIRLSRSLLGIGIIVLALPVYKLLRMRRAPGLT